MRNLLGSDYVHLDYIFDPNSLLLKFPHLPSIEFIKSAHDITGLFIDHTKHLGDHLPIWTEKFMYTEVTKNLNDSVNFSR